MALRTPLEATSKLLLGTDNVSDGMESSVALDTKINLANTAANNPSAGLTESPIITASQIAV